MEIARGSKLAREWEKPRAMSGLRDSGLCLQNRFSAVQECGRPPRLAKQILGQLGFDDFRQKMCYAIITSSEGEVMSTTFTMRLDEDKKNLISAYAAIHGKSMAEFMLDSALDVIEDATDLRDWKAAKKEFDENPLAYSNDEIMREFGLR
jgi:hypothetical protein